MNSGTLTDFISVEGNSQRVEPSASQAAAAPCTTESSSLRRGYVHVYTGNGKGKTTAALGLVLRAVGAGLRVCFVQFLKCTPSSEIRVLERFPGQITIRRFACFAGMEPRDGDIEASRQEMTEVRRMVRSGEYSLIVLDEANVATQFGLLDVEDLLDLIDTRPPESELVITGRYAHPRILDRADLVTEMNEVKHYYRQGVMARVGIER